MPPRRETAPAGVAIVRKIRDFSPACCPSPKSTRIGENGSRNWPHHRQEDNPPRHRSRRERRPPSHRTELDGGDPAHPRLAGRRHHHGAPRPAPPGTTTLAHCHKPSPIGPPRARWEKAGLELTAATAGAPPPRIGCACADVVVSRSAPDLRPRRQRTALETRRRRQEGIRHRAREKTPPPPSPPGLRPAGLSVAARRRGGGEGEVKVGGGIAPRVA
jgi:hypothetical protein